jgi:Concanavalin A-like lectin/glucanases superfamily
MTLRLQCPKPARWPLSQQEVHPAHRFVWQARPRLILPFWNHRGTGNVYAGQNARNLRIRSMPSRWPWRLNDDASLGLDRLGTHLSVPTTPGEVASLVFPNDCQIAANQPYTIALLVRPDPGGAGVQQFCRDGANSTGNTFIVLSSKRVWYRHDNQDLGPTTGVTTISDNAWTTIVACWARNIMELYIGGRLTLSRTSSVATSVAKTFRRFGWSWAQNEDFNGDIGLAVVSASKWTRAMVARWHADPFGFLRPWGAVLTAGAPPPPPPTSTGSGVVVFMMG